MLSNIKLTFDQLEDITLDMYNCNWTDGLTDFLAKHPLIVKVSLRSNACRVQIITERALSEIVRVLPLLNELNVIGPNLPVDKLIGCINTFKLAKYSIFLEDVHQSEEQIWQARNHLLQDMTTRLDNEWKVTINGQIINIERNDWEKLHNNFEWQPFRITR